MKTCHTPPALAADAELDGKVPDDFPVPDELLDLIDDDDALAETGLEDVFLDGRFHSAYFARFQACWDLAVQLSGRIRANGEAAAPPLARNHILARYRTALTGSGWTTPEEAYWITHRVALLLGWNNPLTFVRRLPH